ncbi:MAG TPA: hypothetical protein VFS05_15750 [Gemmatimonadaceae bacterium]|nr:hypothetical protein [Gemmatimonadaceae bacterium]
MTAALRIALLALALALATLVAGWWGVPVAAAAWGVMARGRAAAAREAALAAAIGWALLLAWQATRGPLGALASRLAGVFGVPTPALILITLLWGALLAWSAAAVARYAASIVRQPAPIPDTDPRH